MADEFQLDDETMRLIEDVRAKRAPNVGTPDDQYDLHIPASVIIPVTTPLVNALPRKSVPADCGEILSVSVTKAKTNVEQSSTSGDAKSRTFAQLIFALKCAEQVWIATTLNDWACSHGEPSDPLWNAVYQSDITPEDLQRISSMVRIGVAQSYQGHTEDLGDAVRYIVSVRFAIIIQEPEVATVA